MSECKPLPHSSTATLEGIASAASERTAPHIAARRLTRVLPPSVESPTSASSLQGQANIARHVVDTDCEPSFYRHSTISAQPVSSG